jgi:hypothetical protein
VFFHTAESLVAGDTDTAQDVYQRAGGATTLLSTGPDGGNGGQNATFDGSSQDGTKVFFHTAESLLADDTDTGTDVYERANETTTTIHSMSAGGGKSGAAALFVGASQDGSEVFVESPSGCCLPTDRDSLNDVYELRRVAHDDHQTQQHHLNKRMLRRRVHRRQPRLRRSEERSPPATGPVPGHIPVPIQVLSRLPWPGGRRQPTHSLTGRIRDGTHVCQTAGRSIRGHGHRDDVYERYGGVTSLLRHGPPAAAAP